MNLRTTLGASIGSVLANVIRVLLSFGSAVLAVRLLGLEQFGVASAILAQSVFLHYFLTLGLDQTLPANREPDRVNEIALIGILVSLLLGTAVTLALTSWHPITQQDQVAAFLLLWQAVFSAIGAIIAGLLRFRGAYGQLILKDQILFPLGIFLSSSFFLWLFDATLLVYAIGYVMTAGLLAVAWLIYFRNDFAQVVSSWRLGLSQRLKPVSALRDSAPIGVLSLVEIGSPWAVLVVVSWLFAPEQVGLLAILIRYGALCTFIPMALGPLIAGSLPKLYWVDRRRFAAATQEIMRVTVAGAFVSAGGMLMFFPELLRVAGLPSVPWGFFALILLAFLLDGAFLLSKFAIITSGDRVLYLAGSALSLMLGAAIAAAPVFRHGAIAGGAALVLASVGMLAVRWWLVRRLVGFWLMSWRDALRLAGLFLPIAILAILGNSESWPFLVRVVVLIPPVSVLALVIWRSLSPEGFFLASIAKSNTKPSREPMGDENASR